MKSNGPNELYKSAVACTSLTFAFFLPLGFNPALTRSPLWPKTNGRALSEPITSSVDIRNILYFLMIFPVLFHKLCSFFFNPVKVRADLIFMKTENKVTHKHSARCLVRKLRGLFHSLECHFKEKMQPLNQPGGDRHFNYMVNFDIFLCAREELLSAVVYSRFGITFSPFLRLYTKWHNC